jgi:predicted dehydrogenase
MSHNPNVFVGPNPKIGVIGGGHLGRIHAKLAAANPQCDLVGVADPSVESRQYVQEQLSIAAISDYREWLGTVDGVIVAAPTFLHHEIGQWCLNHGIHVLMEKPVASTLIEASQLVSAAKANHRILQVGHVERFNPSWKLAATQFSSNSIRYIEAAREGTYTGRSTDIGIVMDLMIHDIDLILSAVNAPVESVAAYGWNVLGKNEDFATASLRFRNGTIANLRASRVAVSPKRTMQVFTDEGVIEIDFATNSVTQTAAVEDVANGSRQADELPAELRAKVKDSLFVDWLTRVEQKATPANAIEQEQMEFFRAIQTGSSVTVTGEQGSQALEIASRILEQIAMNQPVRSIIPAADRFGKTKAA